MRAFVEHARWVIPAALAVVAVVGCGAKVQPVKVTAEQLQRSFQKADAPTTEAVVQASTALQTSNYTQAIVIMDRVAQTHALDDAQKKAVDAVIIHTREAIRQNPKLDNRELYEKMSDLMVRVHGEN
jgi:hypothetical protein